MVKRGEKNRPALLKILEDDDAPAPLRWMTLSVLRSMWNADVAKAALKRALALRHEKIGADAEALYQLGLWAKSNNLPADALLFEVTPNDPLTFVTVAAALTATMLLASWIPALRAAQVDPLQALRYE